MSEWGEYNRERRYWRLFNRTGKYSEIEANEYKGNLNEHPPVGLYSPEHPQASSHRRADPRTWHLRCREATQTRRRVGNLAREIVENRIAVYHRRQCSLECYPDVYFYKIKNMVTKRVLGIEMIRNVIVPVNDTRSSKLRAAMMNVGQSAANGRDDTQTCAPMQRTRECCI